MEVNFFDKKGKKNILIIYRPYKGVLEEPVPRIFLRKNRVKFFCKKGGKNILIIYGPYRGY